jgi:hypothetical protein
MPPAPSPRDRPSISSAARPPRVLAIASAGGHWIQLQRMRPAWDGCDVAYVTTNPGYRSHVAPARFYVVRDASRWDKLGLLVQLAQLVVLLLHERPDVVVSTGAAPGYFALRLGRLMGRRTAWIDSLANVDELSLSGARAGRYADLWLTQWQHLARPEGPHFVGAVVE